MAKQNEGLIADKIITKFGRPFAVGLKFDSGDLPHVFTDR